MEREKRNWCKRKYIRLLVIILTFCYNITFANPSLINIEYFPKVAHVSDSFNIKFYMDSRLNSYPKISLNDGGFLTLETSNMFIENGSSVIENQYKINKHGLIKLDKIFLYVEDKRIEVPSIVLEVKTNPLSKDTQFRTRIFEYAKFDSLNKQTFYELNLKNPVTTGKQYFILIEGMFEKIDEQKISIKYKLPDNAIIEKLKTYPIEFQIDEIWKPVAMFLWMPLKKGMQLLPEFELILDISKTQEYKILLERLTLEVLPLEKIKVKKDVVKENFQNILTKELKEEKTFKQYTKEEIEKAKMIKELREKERASFFYSELKKMRTKLEKELGLENVFIVFHYKLYIMSIVIAVIFLSYPICYKIIKKKPFNFYSVLSFCIAAFILTYGIAINDLRKEYTAIEERKINIYTSPDLNATIIENISLGETVKIIHNSKNWLFVETTKNIKGWLQNEENNEI